MLNRSESYQYRLVRCKICRHFVMQSICCYVLFLDEAPSTLDSIGRLKPQLLDFIDPDFGLLDHLLSLEALTSRQYEKVRAGDKAAYERTEAVLDLLTSEDQCGKFLKALQLTGQQHVVNFITQNGGQIDNSYIIRVLRITLDRQLHSDDGNTLCPKKTTLMLHTIDSTHINRFR